MIKDKLLKLGFIPLLGIIIPFLSGIITYPIYSYVEITFIQLYFIFMSWCIWASSAWLHRKIRNTLSLSRNIFIKIATVSLVNAQFGGAIAGVLTLFWYRLSRETFAWNPYLLCIVLSILAVVVFTLIYEILYLAKEREFDSKIVYQLDRERNAAEMTNLRNELEPHFIFNSLNALSYLILNDPDTAHIFNGKLATIYKYFLINKNKETISLPQELEFMEDYIYLLQLRHDNNIELCTEINLHPDSQLMILPFALQIAVENAVKHNEFSESNPLKIRVELYEEYLLVTNKIKPKPYNSDSTGIGLKNLKMRYKLFCAKEVTIEKTSDEFIVKLPLIIKNLKP